MNNAYTARLPIDRPPHWTTRAACLGLATRLSDPWFTHQKAEAGERDTRRAQTICATCPVQQQCGTAGLREDWGVWGAMTATQRRELTRTAPRPKRTGHRIDRAKCGTDHGWQRHRGEGTPICEECRIARSAYRAALKAKGGRG